MDTVHKQRRSGDWLSAVVLAGLLAGWAAPDRARAQTEPPAAEQSSNEDQVSNLVIEVLGKFRDLGDALDQDAAPVPVDALTRAVKAAMPIIPDDDGRDWGSSISFDFTTEKVTGRALDPQADGHVVLTDARDCAPASMTDARIVHFRRFSHGSIQGHHCVVQGISEEVSVLHSTVFAEGADRRLLATYGMAVVINTEPEASAALGEAHLEANIALSTALADYGLAMLTAPATGPMRDPAESLRRLGEALGVDPESFTPSQTEPDEAPAPVVAE